MRRGNPDICMDEATGENPLTIYYLKHLWSFADTVAWWIHRIDPTNDEVGHGWKHTEKNKTYRIQGHFFNTVKLKNTIINVQNFAEVSMQYAKYNVYNFLVLQCTSYYHMKYKYNYIYI